MHDKRENGFSSFAMKADNERNYDQKSQEGQKANRDGPKKRTSSLPASIIIATSNSSSSSIAAAASTHTNGTQHQQHQQQQLQIANAEKIVMMTMMIRFGNVEIIELPMVVGDNPSAIGVPVAIDWWRHHDDDQDHSDEEKVEASCCEDDEHDEHDNNDDEEKTTTTTNRRCCSISEMPQHMRCILPLDQFETERGPVRRTRQQLHWNKKNREAMLLRNGFTNEEIRQAEYEALIIRRSRKLSQNDRVPEEEQAVNDDCNKNNNNKNMGDIKDMMMMMKKPNESTTACSVDEIMRVMINKQFERALMDDKWCERERKENPAINIRQERSPVKPPRRRPVVVAAASARLLCWSPPSSSSSKQQQEVRSWMSKSVPAPFSSPTESRTSGNKNSNNNESPRKGIWTSGGSPDQPLKSVQRRGSEENLMQCYDGDGSIDLESLLLFDDYHDDEEDDDDHNDNFFLFSDEDEEDDNGIIMGESPSSSQRAGELISQEAALLQSLSAYHSGGRTAAATATATATALPPMQPLVNAARTA